MSKDLKEKLKARILNTEDFITNFKDGGRSHRCIAFNCDEFTIQAEFGFVADCENPMQRKTLDTLARENDTPKSFSIYVFESGYDHSILSHEERVDLEKTDLGVFIFDYFKKLLKNKDELAELKREQDAVLKEEQRQDKLNRL